jgi:large subunit ribosomal protein L16
MSMLSPKRTKFRKQQKGKTRGLAKGGNSVDFGDFGLQVTEPGYITARQLEAARVANSRSDKQLGKIYCRVFPD